MIATEDGSKKPFCLRDPGTCITKSSACTTTHPKREAYPTVFQAMTGLREAPFGTVFEYMEWHVKHGHGFAARRRAQRVKTPIVTLFDLVGLDKPLW